MRIFLLIFASWMAFLASNAAVGMDNSRPNVLFIICDDLNTDLGCYGHPLVKTPNIDRLAKHGIRFERAYCQYSLCGPSRASLMTGLYPDQSLVKRNPVSIRQHLPDVVTMSQLFKQSGYTASRIGKIFHYGVPSQIGTSGHDDPKSWSQIYNPIGRDKAEEDQIFSVKPGEYGGYMSWLAADGTDAEQTDGIAADEAIRQIKSFQKQRKSFFLAVGLYRPHTPYVAPKKYFEPYPTTSIRLAEIPSKYLESLPPAARKSIRRKPEHYNISEKLARQAIQAYYASISFADAQVGRILVALEQSGAKQNTIIIFTSDHGYHLGEHSHWLKTALFDRANRVPLIVSVPGLESAGKSTTSFAELVDIYPTVAELAGLPVPKHLSGRSLVPVLNDPKRSVRDSALSQLKDNFTVRTERFRYTQWSDSASDNSELYDLVNDPEEMKNVTSVPRYQKARSEMASLLLQRIVESRKTPSGIKQIPGKSKK